MGLDGRLEILELLHHLIVDLEPAGRINDD